MRVRSAFAMQVAAALLPSIVLLFVVPVVRRGLNLETFAGFTVLISTVGVLTLFDGGLGRGTTYFTSKMSREAGSGGHQGWLWSSMLLGLAFSSAVAVAGLVALHFGGGYFKSANAALRNMLAFSPFFVLGAVLKGVLEGQRRFALSTGLQMLYGCAISLAPLSLLLGARQLSTFSLSAGMIRLCLVVALFFSVSGLFASARDITLSRLLSQSVVIFRYTRWLIVSNMVGLCIVFADRFVIARYFDAHTVASYILPMEMISRAQLLIAAFCSVLFPTLVMNAERKHADYFQTIKSAQGVITGVVLTAASFGVPLAEPVFDWWLGDQLGAQAAQIALIAVLGVALIANASLSMVMINSLGHTRQIAVLHAFEIIVYFVLLYVAATRESLIMLLLAWLTRQLIDAIFMTRILAKLSQPVKDGDGRHRHKSAAALWTLLGVMYCTYLLLVMNLPSFEPAQRIALGLIAGVVSAAAVGVFFVQLRADMRWMRRA